MVSDRKTHMHHCNCCGLTRRGFLSSVALAAGAGAFLAGRDIASASALGDTIPVSSLRPSPQTQVMMGVVRYPPPYWLGWPGTAYDVEAHREQYTAQMREIAAQQNIWLRPAPAPLESDDAVARFIADAQERRPDAVLVMLQHMGAWHWAQWIAEAGLPTIIFSPVGTSFTGHVLEISRRPGVHVISSLEMGAIEQSLAMVRARSLLAATRLLVIAGTQRSETVLPVLGVKVRYIPRRVFRELFEKMPLTQEAREVAERFAGSARKIVEPSREDLHNMARTYLTAKYLLAQENAHGLSMDCLGMVGARVVPTPPCGAWCMLQDDGITAGCEADLFGAISLLFTSYLLRRPGFMNDPVAETFKNRLIAAHCTAGTRLRGFDAKPVEYILRSHSESDLGVSTQVLWPEGEKCTLVRFTGSDELILDTGTIEENIDTPPAGGCRTSFEITMDQVEDARDVLGFHQVVSVGDHRRQVEAYAQMYGLRVIHSPAHSPVGREEEWS